MPESGLLINAPHEPVCLSSGMSDECCLPELSQLEGLLQRLQIRRIFAVVDETAYENSGARRVLTPIFRKYHVAEFSRFEPNPKFDDVVAGLQEFQQSDADVVIALGGGTAIDVAKLISTGIKGASELYSLISQRAEFPDRATPLIAVPTTSGTGSEATQFAVVYVDDRKYSVDHPQLLPAWCVLDPELTLKLPPQITAQSGLDAFCQAIESLWSVRSDDRSMADAGEAARLSLTALHQAVTKPTRESRWAMCQAAHLAGRAINRSRTTACHAISYTLTSKFGIPHGHAVALTLGAMLEFNSDVNESDCNDPRGVRHVQQALHRILSILNCENFNDGRCAIENFVASLGCEIRLSQLGISGSDVIASLATSVNVERMNNNPRQLTHSRLMKLLQGIA